MDRADTIVAKGGRTRRMSESSSTPVKAEHVAGESPPVCPSVQRVLTPAEQETVYHGEIEGIGHALHLQVRDAGKSPVADRSVDGVATHRHGLSALLEWISTHSEDMDVAAVGHRVVHGGMAYLQPVRIT